MRLRCEPLVCVLDIIYSIIRCCRHGRGVLEHWVVHRGGCCGGSRGPRSGLWSGASGQISWGWVWRWGWTRGGFCSRFYDATGSNRRSDCGESLTLVMPSAFLVVVKIVVVVYARGVGSAGTRRGAEAQLWRFRSRIKSGALRRLLARLRRRVCGWSVTGIRSRASLEINRGFSGFQSWAASGRL